VKKVGLFVGLAVLLIAVGLSGNRLKKLEFTTSDPRAFELYERGNEHLFAFQYRQALEPLAEAVALDPDFAMATTALAIAHRRQGNYEVARRYMTIADSLALRLPDAQERMIVQLRLSEFRSFTSCDRDSLQKALEAVAPDNLFLLIAKFNEAMMNNDVATQERVSRTMLEVEPNYANAYNLLGYAAFYRGEYAEAITLMQKYAFVAPDIANPHDSLGDVLSAIGRYEEAEVEFLQALKMQPDFYASLINLGRVYLEKGKIHKGLELLEQVRAEIAGTEIARVVDQQLAFLFYQHPIPESADRIMTHYVTSYPNDEFTPLMRVLRQLRIGAPTALAVLDSTLEVTRATESYQNNEHYRNRMDGFGLTSRALAATREEDYENAAALWGKRLQLYKGYPPHSLVLYRERFADALLEIDRPEQAMAEIATVLEINPRRISALVRAVEIQLALNETIEARKYLAALETALQDADPDFPVREDIVVFRNRLQTLAAGS